MLSDAEILVLDKLDEVWQAFLKLPMLRQNDQEEFSRQMFYARAVVLDRPTWNWWEEKRKDRIPSKEGTPPAKEEGK